MAESPFWLVWNPDHPSPPKKRYPTRQEAQRVARALAAKHSGTSAQVFVLKAQSYHQIRVRGSMVNETMAPWGSGPPCPDPSAHVAKQV